MTIHTFHREVQSSNRKHGSERRTKRRGMLAFVETVGVVVPQCGKIAQSLGAEAETTLLVPRLTTLPSLSVSRLASVGVRADFTLPFRRPQLLVASSPRTVNQRRSSIGIASCDRHGRGVARARSIRRHAGITAGARVHRSCRGESPFDGAGGVAATLLRSPMDSGCREGWAAGAALWPHGRHQGHHSSNPTRVI